MFRYAAVDSQGVFLEVKGQDLFMTKEDAEKAVGKKSGYEVRPVPVGLPLVVSKPKGAPAEVARKRAKLVGKETPEAPAQEVTETAPETAPETASE